MLGNEEKLDAAVWSALDAAPVNEVGGWWWTCNLVVRRALFERIGGFDERFTRVAYNRSGCYKLTPDTPKS